jgi:hypothetical protein
MKAALVILAAALAGCSATVQKIPTPDGKSGFQVSCDGSASDWPACYEAAAKACPGGSYDVLNRDSNSTPSAYGPIVRRSMAIACKQ